MTKLTARVARGRQEASSASAATPVDHVVEPRGQRGEPHPDPLGLPVVGDHAAVQQPLVQRSRVRVPEEDVRAPPGRVAGRGQREPLRREPRVEQLHGERGRAPRPWPGPRSIPASTASMPAPTSTAASDRIGGVPLRNGVMPSAGSQPCSIANWSRRPNHPQIGGVQASPGARPAHRGTRASRVRRSRTCTCIPRRGRPRRPPGRWGSTPTAWQRSHSISAPASCASAVMAAMSAIAALRYETWLSVTSGHVVVQRGGHVRRLRPLDLVGLDPADRQARAPPPAPRRRSGRSGSCRGRSRSCCARGARPAPRPAACTGSRWSSRRRPPRRGGRPAGRVADQVADAGGQVHPASRPTSGSAGRPTRPPRPRAGARRCSSGGGPSELPSR